MSGSLLLAGILAFGQNKFLTPDEKGNGNQATTYDQMNIFYEELTKHVNTVQYLKKSEEEDGHAIYVAIFYPFKERELTGYRKTKRFHGSPEAE